MTITSYIPSQISQEKTYLRIVEQEPLRELEDLNNILHRGM